MEAAPRTPKAQDLTFGAGPTAHLCRASLAQGSILILRGRRGAVAGSQWSSRGGRCWGGPELGWDVRTRRPGARPPRGHTQRMRRAPPQAPAETRRAPGRSRPDKGHAGAPLGFLCSISPGSAALWGGGRVPGAALGHCVDGRTAGHAPPAGGSLWNSAAPPGPPGGGAAPSFLGSVNALDSRPRGLLIVSGMRQFTCLSPPPGRTDSPQNKHCLCGRWDDSPPKRVLTPTSETRDCHPPP